MSGRQIKVSGIYLDLLVGFAVIFCAGVLSVLGVFCYTFLLFADRTAQRDHAWITLLSQRLINGINEKVEHVIRNGDPNGYPGCVNLSFAYVEGESLLMALKVGEFVILS